MSQPCDLTASEAARRIGAGELTSEALVWSCLERVQEREPDVQAWEFLDPELALRQAQARDDEAPRGPLHGVPVAVKDIFDTHDMPTGMGSPIYEGRHRPAADASVVATVRAAGAVILGKTVTTEFAAMTPGKTTNPHDPERTPGGSSSGSAAAVADRMAPVAFGTQTAGSVIRPAAFCGAVGFKPTFGAYNRAGIKFQAESLDTIGLIARSVDDIALFDAVLTGQTPPTATPADAPAPRIGLCRTHLWPEASPDSVEAVEDAAARLAAAGAQVAQVELPDDFAALTEAHWQVLAFEAARALAFEWEARRDELSGRLQETIALGLSVPFEDYRAAQSLAADCRARLNDLFGDCDVLLTMSAAGEAPEGLQTTGDLRFQSLWSFLHVPCMTLPTHRGRNRLPVGTQFVGRHGADRALFAACRWALQCLDAGH